MAREKVKEKKPHRAGRIIGRIIAIILAVLILFYGALCVLTLPIDDTSSRARPVGGMLKSTSISYESESAHGLKWDPVIKLMQVVWRGVYGSDMKAHADQTPPKVTVEKDIPYLDDGNFYHELNVYYPKDTDKDAELPVIIDIHGGGWMYATKDLNDYYCRALADRGYVVFSMSYRLVPDVVVGDQIKDVASALSWIQDNLAFYPCNPDQIMLTGDSAGGMLTIYTAVIQQSKDLQNVFGVKDVGMDFTCLLLTSPVPYATQGLMGKFYTSKLWGKDVEETGLVNYMDLDQIVDYAESIPPTYLITSSGDSLANEQTHMTYDLLTGMGVQCVLQDYGEEYGEKLAHVFSVLDPFDEAGTAAIDGAIEFYESMIKAQK